MRSVPPHRVHRLRNATAGGWASTEQQMLRVRRPGHRGAFVARSDADLTDAKGAPRAEISVTTRSPPGRVVRHGASAAAGQLVTVARHR